MNIHIALTAAWLLVCSALVLAVERYTEARITQVETSDLGIYMFLDVISGDATPVGNEGTNDPLAKSYLILAGSAEEVAVRKSLIAAAFWAITEGTVVRFRREDSGAGAPHVTHMLERN